MIRSFRHRGLQELFETGKTRRIPADQSARIRRRLDVLDAAKEIRDLNLPGFNLHELSGKRRGTWSMWVTTAWRITFRFESGDAFDVDLEQYH